MPHQHARERGSEVRHLWPPTSLTPDECKELAARWRQENAPLCLGGFSNVRAEAVVVAARAQQLVVQRNERTQEVTAAAIIGERFAAGDVRDFTGASVGRAHKGDRMIDHFLLSADASENEQMARFITDRVAGAPIWLRTFAERRADVDFAIALGLHYAGTKIRSTAEVHGIYTNAAFDRTSDSELATLVKLEEYRDVAPLVEALRDLAFTDHYSNYNIGNSWSALSLRGYHEDPQFITKPSEMDGDWQSAHPGCLDWQLCDTSLRAALVDYGIEEALARVGGTLHRVRIMALKGEAGLLERHTDQVDKDSGPADGQVMRFHIPLLTNDGVGFESWTAHGEHLTRHMGVGELWYLDTRKPHRCSNVGSATRYHLVIDVEASESLRHRITHAATAERAQAGNALSDDEVERLQTWLDYLQIDGSDASLTCPLCSGSLDWGELITPDPATERPGAAVVEDVWCANCKLTSYVSELGRYRELLMHISAWLEDMQLGAYDGHIEQTRQEDKEGAHNDR